MVRASSRASLTVSPLTAVITSPDSMPALAAGPLACGSATSAPSAFFRPRLSAISAVTGWIWTPIQPRLTEPLSLSWAITRLHGRCRDRERDADAAAGRRIDRGVDAHHFAVGVEGRTTGVALVHGRVDLDEIVIRTVADVAAAGRNDAGRDGAAEAERIADRQHPVADPGLAVGKLGEREVGAALDLDQRKVGARIGADHLGPVGLAVVGRDFDLVGAVDHVVVGHGKAVGRDEEAGALTRSPGHGRRADRRAGRAASRPVRRSG